MSVRDIFLSLYRIPKFPKSDHGAIEHARNSRMFP